MVPNRTLLAACAVLALTTFNSAQVTQTTIAGDPIAIDSGRVAGVALRSGVHAYLGIPYAAPPVRDLRWRAPQPVTAWSGVFHADRPSPACMQRRQSYLSNGYTGEEAVSEDCLYLNVWTPSVARTGRKLPVIVYIYGGNFTGGSANRGDSDGEQMATRDVIFVTINYRVGAQAVAMLQTSPLVRGLIHRVFAMSSARPSPYVIHDTEEQVERRLSSFPAAVGAKSLAELRAVPADRIAAAQNQFYDPNVDNYFFPEQPMATWAAGAQNDVPAMLSFTRDEDSNDLRRARTVAEYEAIATRMYGDSVETFLKFYPVSTDADVIRMGAEAAREAGHFGSMMFWAAAQRKTGKAPVYLAEFSRVHSYADGVRFAGGFDPKTAGAYHASDIAYYFQNLNAFNRFRQTRNWTAWDRELSGKMADAVAAFATGGSPKTANMAWPEWTVGAPQYIEFGDTIAVHTANKERIEFL